MQPILIGAAERIDDIRQRLDAEFRFLQEEGIDVHIGQTHRGKFTFLGCYVGDYRAGPPDAQVSSLFRHTVANALSDLIVEKWEKDLIRKIIRDDYHYFSPDERSTILDYATKTLSLRDAEGRVMFYKVGRKGRILHQIRDFLDASNELVVEGFVTFRLKDYMEELQDAVDRAVDDYLMEREQREFVRLLKYFVDVQEPRLGHVHVLLLTGRRFELLDDDGSTVRSEYLEEFVADAVDTEVSHDDLLISALITLAPRRLTVHAADNGQFAEGLNTVLAVFAGRAVLCDGCHRCARPGRSPEPVLPEREL